jgi:hypothetical protein
MHDEDEDDLDTAPLADEDALEGGELDADAADPTDLDDEQDAVAFDDGHDIADEDEPTRPEGGCVPDPPDDGED